VHSAVSGVNCLGVSGDECQSYLAACILHVCFCTALDATQGEAMLWIVSKLPEKEVDETQDWQAPIPIDGPLAPLEDDSSVL